MGIANLHIFDHIWPGNDLDLLNSFCRQYRTTSNIQINSNYPHLMFCGDKMAQKLIFNHNWSDCHRDL